MNCEELRNNFNEVISNLNDEGLEKMALLMELMNDFEVYNKNTTPERLREIEAQREQEAEAYKKKCQEEREKAAYEKAKESYRRTQEKLSQLAGKDKKLFDSIEKLKADPAAKRNCLYPAELMLFADVYNNNLINGAYELFLYGFMKGRRVEKLANRKKEGKAA